MTLIIGLNLSDRVCLAADTRATIEDSQGNQKYYDDIFKISPLTPPNVKSDFLLEGKDRIYIAVAGKAILAKHIYEEINYLIKSKIIEYDIREIDKFLNPRMLKKFVNNFYKKTRKDNNLCCSIIFGGVSPNKTKVLPRDKLSVLAKLHSRTVGKRAIKMHPEIPGVIINDNSTIIPDHLFSFNFETGKIDEIVVADSLVFSLDLKLVRNDVGFEYNKSYAEWGEVIARGANGISENSLNKGFLVECEFIQPRTDPMIANILTKQIKRFARKNKSIGGPVIIHTITKESTYPTYNRNEIIMDQGKVYLIDKNGKPNSRFSFRFYPNIHSDTQL